MIFQNKICWNWKLVNLLTQITNLSKGMNVQFLHLYKEANKVADWLATHALANHVTRGYYGQGFPIPIRKLAYQDKIQTPYIRYV